MLEPDDPTTTSTATSTAPEAPTPGKRAPRKAAAPPPEAGEGASPAPRKRASKAAPRPAAETAADDTPVAKKAARKRAAKKAAPDAAEVAVATEPAASPSAPAKKATRKRAAKKAAAPDAEPRTEGPDGSVEPVAPAMSAPGVLFVAPAGEQAGRSKPAKKAAKNAGAKKAGAKKAGAKKAGAKKSTAGEPEPAGPDVTAAEDAEDQTAEPEDVREAAIEQASGARRRRRRGRRGRGGARAADSGTEAADDADDADAATAQDAGDTDGEDVGDQGTHRRRRRRRAGADEDEAADEPNTVVHVREPRAKGDDDGVRAVKGSTRLEAKRQRRRDGRETTRRRAPILTEAEFLARREAVDRVMAVRQTGERTQIAVLEDGVLVEHYVTRASATSYVGNVYLGRVQNVLPSMEAAFVDIGKGRNGVLYAGEVNWDEAGLEGKARAIENALNAGDTVLVQVTKDPIGHKGARLTSQVSLPGRFLVYVPGGGMTGISRRLPDTERRRLKAILKKVVPEDVGVIVRTAAEGASEEDLTRDVERLTAQWAEIQQKAKKPKGAPTLVHGEPDLATRVVRDVFNEDFKSLVVQGDDAWATVSEYIGGVAPDLAARMAKHVGKTDLFAELRVDEQLMKALDRKVWLPSGGSLVIDRTEAMTVIDVNTGKFVGAGGNLEQTVTRNNIEAAEEIVRQLRLRDVGGIVVIDFIDMVLESNRELVLRRLVECLARDRTKHQVAEVTSLGLVQMTRKRVGEGLLEAFSETCETCHGRGVIIHAEPVDKQPAADEDRPAGKGKRKRGKAAPPAEPPDDPATEEQRKAANAAIAAIHRAAAGDKPEDDELQLVDELASDLVQAVAAAEDPAAAPAAVPDDPASATAPEDAEPAPPRRRRRVASRPAGPPGAA